ncbi:saccharopine dehydrogenase NADP-binding domain-containing protein [Petropleomorpha daqingensis]|uniref:Saccharopine dehydrogenase (NAD+, L-lysine-forming) n=1 Tax=Petropleomorpha daqingensis TaxID=2026353 RepID=A0A853C9G4_9ACTN|nr:saccharopine dehydrogenase NADP-binding domain-containing protein [Petropleomorpha daqingensis]NYJ04264.1 saccharopine dehydrogenase (NAD+, L-lysine-forming) [Petropleomorpha daqingensis]
MPTRRGGLGTSDVLLLGAAGNSGALIGAELAARGLSVRLAGRRLAPVDDLARALTARGASAQACAVDVDEPDSLSAALAGARVVLNTVGPFTRRAGPVIAACLAAGVPYVDIANEFPAVWGLLDRDGEARERGVVLVTGAGFGPAATETLVLRLVEVMASPPRGVRVASAAGVTRQTEGVTQSIVAALGQGALTYRDGRLVREPLGSGATELTFGGAARPVFPAPVGDLEAARRASGAADVVAYQPDPSTRRSGTDSVAWAEVTGRDGRIRTAELHLGEGVRATAAIAAETTRRVLAGAMPGAWTPGRLFGADLVPDASGARITLDGVPA